MSLYNSEIVKDNCGFGLMAHLRGEASHRLVRTAISSLARMAHRGGIAADGRSGDGCGLLLQKPDGFFQAIAGENGWNLGGRYGVGMVFFSAERERELAARQVIEEELARDYSIYVFHGTDGDDWDTYGEESLPELEKMLIFASRVGITIAENGLEGSRRTEVEKYLSKSGLLESKKELLRLDVMTKESTEARIIEGIKHLIS